MAACSVPAVTYTPGNEATSDGGLSDGRVDGQNRVTITVGRSGAATGTVSVQGLPISCGASCSASVVVGTSVTLVATPDLGSVFGGWTGDGCTGSDVTCTITVTKDISVVAAFEVAMSNVTIAFVGSGAGVVMSTAGLLCPGQCTGRFAYNTVIELSAAPSETSMFMGWQGPCSGTGACSFTVTADTEVKAAFATTNELIVMRNGNGRVTSSPGGISCGGDCSERYAPGTPVVLSAVADGDSTFTGWSGEGCTGTGTCQITMDQAAMVTAAFVLRQHKLEVASAGNGSGTVLSTPAGISCGDDCDELYDAHTVVELTASPQTGSSFRGWSGVDCPGVGPCIVTMEAAVSITATFALQQFVLTVARDGAGTGSVQSTPGGINCGRDCMAAFDFGTTVELRATPAPGSGFAGWQGDCSGFGLCQLSISRATSVTAVFVRASGLFVPNVTTDHLERIDPITHAVADVGPLNIDYDLFGDCAWNPADATLYLTDGPPTMSLYRVNLATGATSLVGRHGISFMAALAYHPPSNTLYGISADTDLLYSLSTVTGAATLIGPTGADQIEGLAWDSRRNVMTALSPITLRFYTINLATGAATMVAPASGVVNLGMGYDPAIDRFWVADRDGRLVQFDPNLNFVRTDIATNRGMHSCIAVVPDAP